MEEIFDCISDIANLGISFIPPNFWYLILPFSALVGLIVFAQRLSK